MREIKFRAWDKERKEILYARKAVIFAWIEDKPKFIIPMQYTGLKDKNGKEIYEGDIIKNGRLIQKVYFELNESCYKIKCLNCYDKNGSMLRDLRLIIDKEVEVIGNIYENPKLLGIKQELENENFKLN